MNYTETFCKRLAELSDEFTASDNYTEMHVRTLGLIAAILSEMCTCLAVIADNTSKGDGKHDK